MNEYRFDDLFIGMKESFDYEINPEKMKSFMELTGDINPLHTDSEFAVSHGYKDKVVYGMLSASLLSTLGGCYLPGMYCLIQQVEVKFVSPVFYGDILTVTGTVKELFESVHRAVLKVDIFNQAGKKVIKGTLDVGFLE